MSIEQLTASYMESSDKYPTYRWLIKRDMIWQIVLNHTILEALSTFHDRMSMQMTTSTMKRSLSEVFVLKSSSHSFTVRFQCTSLGVYYLGIGQETMQWAELWYAPDFAYPSK